MRRNVSILVLLVFVVNGYALEQDHDQEIVDRFFPVKLSTRKKFKDMISKQSEFISADLDKTGKEDYIVAAYSNGSLGAVQVLRRSGSSALVADLKEYRNMQGGKPELTLQDLDGDRRPEIIVKFQSARNNTSDWIFRWSGKALDVIGPAATDENGELETLIGNSILVDLYGDGRLHLIDGLDQGFVPPEDSRSETSSVQAIYVLSNGKFVLSESSVYSAVFKRRSGAPVEELRKFSADRAHVNCVLKIINGGPGNEHRVSSGEVRLNGQLIADLSSSGQDQGVISFKVVLAKSNELKVLLKGQLNGFIRVLVEPIQEPAGSGGAQSGPQKR